VDFISDNPYRILGVFANDPIKVRTANIAKIRAFRKVGKYCHFECDYTEIFGAINRSEEAIEEAISKLASNEESEFYSYFWLHRAPGLITNSEATKAAIDIIRANINGKSIQNYINVFIGSLCTCNYDLAAQDLIKIFESTNSPSETIKERIITTLNKHYSNIDTTTGDCQWWYKFKDTCKSISNSEESLNLLRRLFNRESIKALHEITEANIWDHNDKQGIVSTHIRIAKPIIEIILDTCAPSTSEPNAESQITLDGYANHILNLCKYRYHRDTFGTVKSAEYTLELLQEIYRISFSDSVKEECSEFKERIRNDLKYLAPNELQAQASAIHKEISDFCQKPNETRWGLYLIRNCVKSLIEIKESLGKDNPYYKHISTRIANNALYTCTSELESAKRKYNNPQNDRTLATKHLSATFKQALQLKVDICQLNLEDDFVSGKLQSFFNQLTNDCQEYGLVIEEPLPSISLKSDNDLYAECNDYASLLKFIQSNPSSSNISNAIKRIWEIEDKSYPQLGTSISAYLKALFRYKERFPNSHNETKLFNEINDILINSTVGTISDYRTVLRLYPNHPKKATILDCIDWLSYRMCSQPSDWEEYIKNFPNGRFKTSAVQKIKEAKKQKEEIELDKCSTISEYIQFCTKHPTSDLLYEAQQRLEDVYYKEALTSGVFSSYYKRYPHGRYIGMLLRAEDKNFYKSCKSGRELKKYIRKYPDGIYAKEAKQSILEYNTRLVAYVVIFICFIIVGVSVILYFNSATDQVPNVHLQNEDTATENVMTDSSYDTQTESTSSHPSTYDYTGLQGNNSVSEIDREKEEEEIKEYLGNQLSTGSKPYSSQLGEARTGENYLKFKTSRGRDYVVIVKRTSDNKYFNHVYIRGGNTATIYLPDGTFTVYFYSGIGWNPNKIKGNLYGGFVSSESLQKDGSIDLRSSYCEYTLYPVENGNLSLKRANDYDVFNN
jgi:hypothetical protein